MSRVAALVAALVLAAAACDPGTTRPRLVPGPEAPSAEVRGDIPSVTERVAAAFEAEGLPVERIEPRDGWLRTRWLDTAGFRPVSGSAHGLDAVRVRGWIDPGGYGSSRVTLEAVYRPLVDPSLPERELERPLPSSHPAGVRIRRVLERLAGPAVVPAGPAPGE